MFGQCELTRETRLTGWNTRKATPPATVQIHHNDDDDDYDDDDYDVGDYGFFWLSGFLGVWNKVKGGSLEVCIEIPKKNYTFHACVFSLLLSILLVLADRCPAERRQCAA